MEDLTDDLSGAGVNQDRWNIFGDPNNLVAGTAAPIPCFGIAPGPNNLSGSNFAKPGTGCTVVPAGSGVLGSQSLVANLPAECLIAAGVSDTNPSVPAANNGYGELATLGCYLQNGTAIAPTAQGTYGNMGRNVLRGQPFKETDLSITKTWKFGERLTTQFRAEFFNIFNATEFSNPGQSTQTADLAAPAQLGAASSTPNTFSFVFGSGGPRTAQLGLKFLF